MADLSNAEKIEFPENVGDGSLAEFQREGDDERFDFQKAMQGDENRHSEGGRHDLEQRGFTSQSLEEQERDIIEQQQWQPQEENLFAPSRQQQQSDDTDWKKMYGQSENEKGELRKNVQALLDRVQQLEQINQQTSYANLPPPPQFYGSQPPQQQVQQPPTPAQQQFAPPQAQWSQLPDLIEKDDNEMLVPSDVNKLVREKLAPYLEAVAWRAQQAEQQALMAQQRLYEGQKLQMGLNPQVEMQILSTKPWLRNIQDPNAYLGAMQQELGMLQAQQQAAQRQQAQQLVTPQPQQQQRPAPNEVMRRRTFVERGNNAGQEPSKMRTPQQIWQEEWQKTLLLPHGSREKSERQRHLLNQAGMNQTTGYRNPSILTR